MTLKTEFGYSRMYVFKERDPDDDYCL